MEEEFKDRLTNFRLSGYNITTKTITLLDIERLWGALKDMFPRKKTGIKAIISEMTIPDYDGDNSEYRRGYNEAKVRYAEAKLKLLKNI